MTVRNITFGQIEDASKVDNIDLAVSDLQLVAGIDDGGVAGVCFSGFEWDSATMHQRLIKLYSWLMVERAYEREEQL
jgi:hypothetical protein